MVFGCKIVDYILYRENRTKQCLSTFPKMVYRKGKGSEFSYAGKY